MIMQHFKSVLNVDIITKLSNEKIIIFPSFKKKKVQ